MRYDYRLFIGRAYEPPHGCFRLVQQVFEQAYGLALADHDAGLDPSDLEGRSARFQQALAQHCVTVTQPKEGDLILIGLGGKPFHIGVVTAPGEMLHAYSGGSAVIESYRSLRWSARIAGFWRYRG